MDGASDWPPAASRRFDSGHARLDLGTGLGHVARLAGEVVGPAGSVVDIDRSADALAVARERTAQAKMAHVTFSKGT